MKKQQVILDVALRKRLTEIQHKAEEVVRLIASLNNLGKQRSTTVFRSLFIKVEELDLPIRTINCLKAAKILFLGDLVQKRDKDLLKFRNFGRNSLEALKSKLLADFNFTLEMKLTNREQRYLEMFRQKELKSLNDETKHVEP